ncbi:MAG TPA: hypothetical protein VGB96_03865 [Archangium sp.]
MLAALALLLEAAFAVFVIVAGAVMFGFSGEGHRHPNAFGSFLQFLALALAFVPLGVTVWVAVRRFSTSRPWPSVPLGLWLPAVAGLACLVSTWVLLILSEFF